jgi:hypothetical protein
MGSKDYFLERNNGWLVGRWLLHSFWIGRTTNSLEATKNSIELVFPLYLLAI